MPAISSNGVLNRLSQAFPVSAIFYNVGKVAIYTRKKVGTSPSTFNIHLNIYEADLNGIPTTMIAESTISSDEIISTGWTIFTFNLLSQQTPTSGMMALVFYQEGGDENNYVSWFYGKSQESDPPSHYSCDGGVSWEKHQDIVRSARVMIPTNVFSDIYNDTEAHRINTSPGLPSFTTKSGNNYLLSGTFSKTMLEENNPSVIIDHNKLMVSTVVDCSGSMGWNDRAKNKVAIAQEIINSIKDKYPGQSVFDIIRIGSTEIGNFVWSGTSTYNSVRLDFSNPDRTFLGNNGETILPSDIVIASGFKNLQSGHSYTISSVTAGNFILIDGKGFINTQLGIRIPSNIQSVGPSSSPALFSIQDTGPGSELEPPSGIPATVVEIPGVGTNQIRSPLASGAHLVTTGILQTIEEGSTVIPVISAEAFTNNEYIDLIDSGGIAYRQKILSLTDHTVVTLDGSPREFGSMDSEYGGFVQQSSRSSGIAVRDITFIDLLILDSESDNHITFYVQTQNGGRMEWDFDPLKEWVKSMAVFADEILTLSAEIYDDVGNVISNNAEIHFYVDTLPSWSNTKKDIVLELPIPVTKVVGEDQIEILSLEGVSVGDAVELVSVGDEIFGGYTIEEIDEETNIITIFPPLLVEITVKIIIIIPKITPDLASEPIAMVVTAVDVTPIFTGVQPNYHARLPTDPHPVPISAGYDDFNQDESRWLHNSFSIPSVRIPNDTVGNGVIHILPITDDYVKSNIQKEEEISLNANKNATLSDKERMEIEALEDAYREISEDFVFNILDNQEDEDISSESDATVVGLDYIIAPSVILYGETASMTTTTDRMDSHDLEHRNFAFDMSEVHNNDRGIIGGEVIARNYKIWPVLVITDDFGNPLSRFILEKQEAYFMSPIHIFSRAEQGKIITLEDCCCYDEVSRSVNSILIPGVVALSGQSIRIDYFVYDHNLPMSNGTMRVKIFDATRTRIQVLGNPMDSTPDLFKVFDCVRTPNCRRCKEDESEIIEKEQRQYFRRRNDGSYFINDIGSARDGSFAEATYLNGYQEGGFEVPVLNGRASITIPATHVVAKLKIFAEVKNPFNNIMSCVKEDIIVIDNPVRVTFNLPLSAESGLTIPPFEVTSCATYFGNPIEDNTEISIEGSSHYRWKRGEIEKIDPDSTAGQYIRDLQDALGDRFGGLVEDIDFAEQGSWPATPVLPETGRTINGCANGFLVGPHELVVMREQQGELLGDKEDFTATVNYAVPGTELVYPAYRTKYVEWTSELLDVGSENPMAVTLWKNGGKVISGHTTLYADGWEILVVIADIPASVNNAFGYFDDPLLAEEMNGTSKQEMSGNFVLMGGGGPPGGVTITNLPPLGVEFAPDPITGGITLESVYPRFHRKRPVDPVTGIEVGDEPFLNDSTGWAAVTLTGSFVVPSPPKHGDPCSFCEWSPHSEIYVSTSVQYSRVGKRISFWGCGSEGASQCLAIPSPECGVVKKRPCITWIEPLKSKIRLNGIADDDGEPLDIFRDGINSTVVDAEVEFSGEPIPIVARRHNVKDANGIDMPFPLVNFEVFYIRQERNVKGEVIHEETIYSPDLTLSAYSVPVSVSKTNVVNEHYHDCEVDNYGNGITTKTYTHKSIVEIDSHIHEISNYIVNSGVDSEDKIHSHQIKSVASTKINPITNNTYNICVKATVSYDASRKPVQRILSTRVCTTLELWEYWTMNLRVPTNISIREDVTQAYPGYTIRAELIHIVNGVAVAVPNGTRINFDFQVFKPYGEKDLDDIITFGEGRDNSSIRPRAVIKVRASASPDGKFVMAERDIGLTSNLEWFPSVKNLTPHPTSDIFYIERALEQISGVKGYSQISDAVFMAADRMNAWQIKNNTWKSSNKIIFLLSDGDENQASITRDQVIQRASQLSGEKKSPVMTLLFGLPHFADEMLVSSYAAGTNGLINKIPIGYESNNITDLVKSLFETSTSEFNSGTYTNVVDIGNSNLINSADLTLNVPAGAVVIFRSRFSDDGIQYGNWTNPITLTESGSINIQSIVKRYMQYEVKLYGNANFLSPKFSQIVTNYIQANHNTIFFRPINVDLDNDEYVNEVIITHEGNIPSFSTVKYGLCHFDNEDPLIYSSAQVPLTDPHRRVIILTRFNEETTTSNRIIYNAVNGSWPETASVEIHRIQRGMTQADIVQKSEYSVNPSTGTITMMAQQSIGSIILVSISTDPVLRLVCVVTNNSQETASIDHIGVMYNKTKRFTSNPDGTIIRQPIYMEYNELFSSSLSSDSSDELSTS